MADIPADGDVLTNPGSFEKFSTRALAGPSIHPRGDVCRRRGRRSGRVRAARLDESCRRNRRPPHAGRPPRLARARDRLRHLKRPRLHGHSTTDSASYAPETTRTMHRPQAVNAHFPYTPLPELLVYRGPLAAESQAKATRSSSARPPQARASWFASPTVTRPRGRRRAQPHHRAQGLARDAQEGPRSSPVVSWRR